LHHFRYVDASRCVCPVAASYETPQRVEMVARTLLGMTPPPPERVIALRGYAPRAPTDDGKPDEADSMATVDAGAPASDGGAP